MLPDLAVVFVSPNKLAPLGGVPLAVYQGGGAFESRHPVQDGCHELASGPPIVFCHAYCFGIAGLLTMMVVLRVATAIPKQPVCPRRGIESIKLRVHGCSLPSRKRPPLSACGTVGGAARAAARFHLLPSFVDVCFVELADLNLVLGDAALSGIGAGTLPPPVPLAGRGA